MRGKTKNNILGEDLLEQSLLALLYFSFNKDILNYRKNGGEIEKMSEIISNNTETVNLEIEKILLVQK